MQFRFCKHELYLGAGLTGRDREGYAPAPPRCGGRTKGPADASISPPVAISGKADP